MSNWQNIKMSLAVAAIVLGFSAVLFAPAKATSESDSVTITAGEVGYLPAQYVNHGKIEPQPATF